MQNNVGTGLTRHRQLLFCARKERGVQKNVGTGLLRQKLEACAAQHVNVVLRLPFFLCMPMPLPRQPLSCEHQGQVQHRLDTLGLFNLLGLL